MGGKTAALMMLGAALAHVACGTRGHMVPSRNAAGGSSGPSSSATMSVYVRGSDPDVAVAAEESSSAPEAVPSGDVSAAASADRHPKLGFRTAEDFGKFADLARERIEARVRDALLPRLVEELGPYYAAGLPAPEVHMINTTDGASLHTLVYRADNHLPGPEKRSSVLVRTPYGALRSDTVAMQCAEAVMLLGLHCVAQDFRGRFGSTGTFSFFTAATVDAEVTDAYIAAQPWSDGTVLPSGMSADGIAGYLSLRSRGAAEHTGAISVFSGTSDLYTTAFQQGALRWSLFVGWLTVLGEESFIPKILATETDPAAVAPATTLTVKDLVRNVISRRPGSSSSSSSSFLSSALRLRWPWSPRGRLPSVHVAGFFDIFGQPQLSAVQDFEGARGTEGAAVLIAEPGGHCSGGQFPWVDGPRGLEAAAAIRASMFRAAARAGPGAVPSPPSTLRSRAWYVMGSPGGPGGYWAAGRRLPRSRSMSFYLSRGGKLRTRYHRSRDARGKGKFAYDPRRPVPTIGGANLIIPQCGSWDQSSVEDRDDVLVFTSKPLAADLHITGRVKSVLYVSSDRVDTDFTVKLTEVSRQGTGANATDVSMLIADGIVRMRWRKGMYAAGGSVAREPVWMHPGRTYKIEVDLWSTSWVFAAGNRVRVAVSSSNYPRFSNNLNNGNMAGGGGEPLVANNVVSFDRWAPSRIELPVVRADDQPRADMSQFAMDLVQFYNTVKQE